jgi:capsular polysaccharide biosynthesis protein
MPGAGGTLFRPASLLDWASDPAVREPSSRVFHAQSLAPHRVEVPPLRVGAGFLEAWPVLQRPASVDWRASYYNSMAPATFVFRHAVCTASAGILTVDGEVVAETLLHTDPALHGYRVTEAGLVLERRETAMLEGTSISILAGAGSNYYHATMESAVRLAMIPSDELAGARTLLYPAGAAGVEFALRHFGLPRGLALRAVSDGEALRCERLVFPWSVHGESHYHRCTLEFFDAVSSRVPDGATVLPRRFYVDRRGAAARRLVNEDEVAGALAALGVVAVRPETMDLADQIRLFRGAELVVAPHGAGLTNIGYCRPGAAVLELSPSDFVRWCYRPLAALRGLRYDCVLGRPTQDGWRISASHVAGATAMMT